MGLFSSIRDFFYSALTKSRIVYRLVPILEPVLTKRLEKKDRSNHKLVDASGHTLSCVKFNDRHYPAFGVDNFEKFSSIKTRADDVFLCGYPKTGCHWTYEILYMLVNRRTQLTRGGKAVEGMMEALPHIVMDSTPSPRILNTHMLYTDMPEDVRTRKNKIIYTIRNPKDTCVSFYNHTINLKSFYHYEGEFDDYFKLFMEDQVEYGGYFDFVLDWDKHIRDNPDQILMISYEELKAQPVEVIKRIANFLKFEVTDEFVAEVAEASSFKNMKEKRAGNAMKANIFRKGQVGDWRNWLSDEQSAAIDKVWEERMTQCLFQPEY